MDSIAAGVVHHITHTCHWRSNIDSYRFAAASSPTKNTCAHRVSLRLDSAAQVTQRVVILPAWRRRWAHLPSPARLQPLPRPSKSSVYDRKSQDGRRSRRVGSGLRQTGIREIVKNRVYASEFRGNCETN